MADLAQLLEDEVARKTDAERRSRRSTTTTTTTTTTTCNNNNSVTTYPVGTTAATTTATPCSSELRRYGKKLEEAVRSREHAADVAERLVLLPSRRRAGSPSSTTPAALPADVRFAGGMAQSGMASTNRGGGGGRGKGVKKEPKYGTDQFEPLVTGAGDTRRRSSNSSKSSSSKSRRSKAGVDRARDGGGGKEGAEGPPTLGSRRALSEKLREVVRVAREDEISSDDRFFV